MSITSLLGIKYPIIQGAMANISDAVLASSVSNAGGLGIIASGGLTKEELEKQIDQCRKLTKHPFGVNLMLMAPNRDELVKVIIEKKVPIVTTGAGSPKEYMKDLKKAGIIVIPVIPSSKIAKKMELLGADAVIAEGMEAGGHIGSITTMSLVPSVVDRVSIPVIAAGGIADGRGMAAAFCLGASGVQIGTRFLASSECNISENYKNKVIDANEDDTIITGIITEAPVRVLKNKMSLQYKELEQTKTSFEELEKLTMGSLKKAISGDVENGSLMSGQIAGIIHAIEPTSEIISNIMNQFQQLHK